MIDYKVDMRLSGPVFDGMAERERQRFINDAVYEVAEEGWRMVRWDFDVVHKRPSRPPYARSRVKVDHGPGPHSTIGDGGLIYGPWLEGTGSRNRSSRFKGYWTFRRVAWVLDGIAGDIARRVLPAYVRRMNGGA